MKPIKPSTEYKKLRLLLAYESSIDEKEAIQKLESLLVNNSVFSDWLMTTEPDLLRSKKQLPKAADRGYLFNHDDRGRFRVSRMFRIVARFKNRGPIEMDRSSLDGARATARGFIQNSKPEEGLVDVLIKKRSDDSVLRRRRGAAARIDFQPLEVIKPTP